MTITDLQLTKNRKRINIYIDGEFSFAINKDVAVDSRLYKGIEITEKQIIKLKDSDSLQRCMDAAFNFLSYRPRSEMEVKQRLRRRGFSQEIIEKVIYKLKKKAFINDAEFVRYWLENRAEFNPKGRTILKIELKQKGIRRDLLNDMLGDVNEENNAYRAALKKSHVLKNLEYDEFKSRMFTYLKWRGFGYEVIEVVCNRIWQEMNA
jgi:regulatory protein